MMLSCLILSLMLAGAASGSNVEKRIVGGSSCKTEGKYHVKVSWKDGQSPCGASLLNTNWLLTAARCGKRLLLKAGKTHYGLFYGSNIQKIDVKQQYFYGEENDIMLIKLNKAVKAKYAIELPPGEAGAEEAAPEEAADEEAAPEEAAQGVSTPPVKQCTGPSLRQTVQIGGWGDNGGKPKHRCAKTKITKCEDKDKKGGKHATTLMCAHSAGVQSCEGDAGSAMVYDNKLYGIIVNKRSNDCTNVSEILDICFYLDWITKTMRENP
ncbi:trypsin-1-like [Gadus chalcogrammus]|uniref:trypsin-1-like n=1 Tax=Gadus chalcogrammus TaxID=1042646 RepID=UPI0024C28D12|nr:trypsin-1-like [Gadus chalcogrammus]